MKFLSNVRIGTRLAIGFGLVLALTLVSAAFALMSAKNNAEATRVMMQSPLVKERLISDWYVLTYSAIARTSMIAKSSDETLPVAFAEVIADSSKRGAEPWPRSSRSWWSRARRRSSSRSSTCAPSTRSPRTWWARPRPAGTRPRRTASSTRASRRPPRRMRARSLALLADQRGAIDRMSREIDQANARSFNLRILLTVLTLAIGGLCAFLISRSITQPARPRRQGGGNRGRRRPEHRTSRSSRATRPASCCRR